MMSSLALRLVLVALAFAGLTALAPAPAQAYDERPMRLRPRPRGGAAGRGGGAAAAAASAAQPSSWLVAAQPGAGAARAAAIAPRFGARRLQTGAVYRVATGRARAFAAALRAAGALRYAEPNARLRRAERARRRSRRLRARLRRRRRADAARAGRRDDRRRRRPRRRQPSRPRRPHAPAQPGADPRGARHAGGVGRVGRLQRLRCRRRVPGRAGVSVGLPLEITCADAANAILAAANSGAKVLNLSFGSPSDCATLFGAVQIAFAKGTPRRGGGRQRVRAGQPGHLPGRLPARPLGRSLNPDLKSSGFSSANAAVDVAAPGVDIPVATPGAFDTEDGALDGVTRANGTSFAAPIVSGAAAWLATVRPDLSNGQLADVLRRSARDVDRPGYDTNTGFGLVHMAAALALPAPARDVLEPNDGITFVNGSVFSRPDPVRLARQRPQHAGRQRRQGRGSLRRLPHPPAAPARARGSGCARLRQPRPLRLPLERDVGQRRRDIVARSRKGTLKTDAVTIRNAGRSARRFYVAIGAGQRRRPERLLQPAVSAREVPLSGGAAPSCEPGYRSGRCRTI